MSTFIPHPDDAEVQLCLLCTLQDELETAFALIGHPIIIVPLQNPLLLRGKHRAQVHLEKRQQKKQLCFTLS